MKINSKLIRAYKPCKDRIDNFDTQYPKFNGTLENFLALDNITYKDKVWVFTHMATKTQNIKWSILCAQSTLNLFESKYPNDFRPRDAINSALNYLETSVKSTDAAAYADAAATYATYATTAVSAEAAAACAAFAAYAALAAYAEADAASAHSTAAASAAEAAATSAAEAAAACARTAAASAAEAAATNECSAAARITQEDLNLLFMLEAIL